MVGNTHSPMPAWSQIPREPVVKARLSVFVARVIACTSALLQRSHEHACKFQWNMMRLSLGAPKNSCHLCQLPCLASAWSRLVPRLGAAMACHSAILQPVRQHSSQRILALGCWRNISASVFNAGGHHSEKRHRESRLLLIRKRKCQDACNRIRMKLYFATAAKHFDMSACFAAQGTQLSAWLMSAWSC